MCTATGKQRCAGSLRVYFVEDSPIVLERLESIAAEAGAQPVGHAVAAREAIDAILALRPDVVITDLRLADGTGFDVLRAVHEAAPDIELYMLSNFADEPYRRIARQLGAREFFDKTTEFGRVGELIAARTTCTH